MGCRSVVADNHTKIYLAANARLGVPFFLELRSPSDGPAQLNPTEVRRSGVQAHDHAERRNKMTATTSPGQTNSSLPPARILCFPFILPGTLAFCRHSFHHHRAWTNPSPTWCSAKRNGGWRGLTFPPVSARGMPGAEILAFRLIFFFLQREGSVLSMNSFICGFLHIMEKGVRPWQRAWFALPRMEPLVLYMFRAPQVYAR